MGDGQHMSRGSHIAIRFGLPTLVAIFGLGLIASGYPTGLGMGLILVALAGLALSLTDGEADASGAHGVSRDPAAPVSRRSRRRGIPAGREKRV